MDRSEPILDQVYVQQVLPHVGTRRLVTLVDLSCTTDTLELYVALMTCVWGIWLVGWDLVAHQWYPWAHLSGPTNVLNLMFTFMPQWAWGTIGGLIGAGHLLTRLNHIRLRRTWLLLSLMFWAAVMLTIAVHVPYSTGIIAYGGLAFASGLSYLRLYIIDSRILDVLRKPLQGP